ncbi:hypothetical protein ECDEC3F_2160 [Escherichia coli DEC3F]|nr:hypothetical protein ECDEC3F_2160 [Escherichia coli DEC3F]ESS90104.1 hypothetical protein L342_4176 [Escherichia coli CE516]
MTSPLRDVSDTSLPGSSYARRLSSPSGDTTAVSWFPSL